MGMHLPITHDFCFFDDKYISLSHKHLLSYKF